MSWQTKNIFTEKQLEAMSKLQIVECYGFFTGTDANTSLGVSEMPVENLYDVSNFLMDKHDKLAQYKKKCGRARG